MPSLLVPPSISLVRRRGGRLVLAVAVLGAVTFGLGEYLDIFPSHTSLLDLLSASSDALGQTVDLAWYPPSKTQINSLASAVEGKGIYGYIFNSSVTPNHKYGTYNWCNMPHVRKTEYVKPSADFDLEYVEVIQRHHKRTPYASNAFPVESYQWNCNDQGLYYFGKSFTEHGKPAAETFWDGYISDINPFVPSGWVGSCQFPQITAEGLDGSWVHGNDLYGVYHDLLNFIPSRKGDWRSKVAFRVTNNQITSQVAAMFINGMWGTTESVPLLIQQGGVDSLEPQYTCRVGGIFFDEIKSMSNAEWQRHLNKGKALFSTLDDISGVPLNDVGFHESFDHYFDNLSARQCHGKPLPCKLEGGKNSTTCVNQELADAVYRMGQWEYSQIYRDASLSLAASSATYGVWIAELASHLRAVIGGGRTTIYLHNFAHDGSLSRLLSILQIDVMVWPGMGSEVVFELYKKNALKPRNDPVPTPSVTGDAATSKTSSIPSGKSGYHVRVLFMGQVLRSSNPSLGLLDMVPVETILAYFDGLTGPKASLIPGKCGNS
ncbi:hypothetical protein AK830_g5179 [Neonectria ditissima]|uniref:Counting factor 60 n=1 Tax=Neonectria ditissima TaxID=78410 RepID=A0A0P7BES6_9HYPO|nr:hypothetical protein AK830_g5179 [Neonectria ditissima]